MNDLIGICGQVRGLTPRLLSGAQIDRMIGAATAEESFRVLTELQYADYIDQDTTLSDFGRIITQGLKETRDLLASGAGDHPGLDFLWLGFDLNNVKRALKAKLVAEASDLGNFDADEAYSHMGNLSPTDLQRLVFEGKPSGPLPYQILAVVGQAAALYQKDKSFRAVEFALDKAYFEHLNAVAEALQDEFLTDFFTFLVNLTQARNLARSVLTIGEALPEEGVLPFGHLAGERATKITNYDELSRALRATELSGVLAEISEGDTPAQKMLKIEQGLDKAYHQYLASAATGSLDSPAVLMHYFNQRLHNARVLKLIMYGKLNGVSPDKIYDLVGDV